MPEVPAMEKVRVPLYKKLVRFTIMCAVCMKITDCMAENQEDANRRFTERGWRSMTIKQKERAVTVPVCKRCMRELAASRKVHMVETETEAKDA